MLGGGTIFALLTMLGAATVLIAWGGWVLDQIDEALGEALRPNPTTDEPKED